MPAWGEANAGPLNDEQIEELIVFIQNVDWNHVYNEAVAASGGYPTAPPVGTTPAATEPATPTEPNTYNITMGDNFFNVGELILPANTEVTFNFTNEGTITHNFTVDELGIFSGDMAAGESKSVTVTTGDPGEWEFYCSIPGHRESGMSGRLVVTDDPSLLPQPAGADATPAPESEDGEQPAEPAAAVEVHVDMIDVAFEPKTLTLPANAEVTITFANTGVAVHNFTAEELGIASGDYQPGQTGSVTITTGGPGEYTYICAVPGHADAGMTGTIIVQ
jgi:nitrite reductase (NO-forming)